MHRLVGLVDREVELRYQRAIMPRLANLVGVLLGLVAWKKPDDDERGEKHEAGADGQAVPDVLLLPYDFLESVHVADLNAALYDGAYVFLLRKYEKKSIKAEKKY